MADGKIYITISDTRGGSGTGVNNEADTVNESSKKENAVAQYARHRFFNFVESQAKQYVNYTVSNIGNFTGDYTAQRNIEEAMTVGGMLLNLGTSVIAGAKMGGPYGAIIAATITVGSKLIEFGYREKSEQFQNRKTNRNIDMMRNRLGLQGLTDSSRTGGY